MTDWDKLSDEEREKKYADMMMTEISFIESGELDDLVEEDVRKLKELLEKLKKDRVIIEINGTDVKWKWDKWWERE